jgi:diguanylate cyclase (GGDEF)-like protein/PAS domain S-box-containing protein
MVEAVDPVPKLNFMRLLALAARVLGVPMAAITTLDDGKHIAPYNFGMENPGETVYICAYAIRGDDLLVIPDTFEDPRVSQMSVVTGPPNVRFYAGAPLISPSGRRLGTLAVMDRRPRTLTYLQKEDIKTFADQVMSQLEVRHQRQELHALASNLEESHRLAHLGNWEWDKKSDAVTWSREVYAIFGRSLADPIANSRNFLELVQPEDRARVSAARDNPPDSRYELSYRITRPDGQLCCIQERAEVMRDKEGNVTGLSGYLQDMTVAWKAEQDRRESEKRFRSMFEQAAVGISLTQLDGKFAEVNQRFASLVGYSREELSQLGFQSITHPDDLAAEMPLLNRLLRGESETYAMEKRFVCKNGDICWSNVTVSIRRNESGAPQQFIAVVEDIAARKRAEADLRSQQQHAQYLASHDSLTGLPNRSLLHDRLNHAIARAHRSNRMVAVMFLDLDRFKLINDTLGHKSGDQLLQTMAGRLQQVMREGDTVARLGGDEFVILAEDLPSEEIATNIAEQVLKQISGSVSLDGHQLVLSTSIGISVYPKDSQNEHVLLKQADIAMYQAKEKGGSCLRYFDPEMNSHVLERLIIENGLRRALEFDELGLRYQPLVDLKTGRIVGMEALVRWNHPEKGLIGPDQFISVAEETGLIIELGEWVLRKACRQQQEWFEKGLSGLRMAVNLSVKQFGPRNLVSRVRSVLDEIGMAPSLLKLEITETGLMQDVARTQGTLLELAAMGIELAIDDFGTGYSSLSYLKTLPIDTLKVDRSFVNDVAVDTDDAAIVSATIGLAHNLGLRVIAEGVETPRQLSFLALQNCDEGQGYYFSSPLASNEMEELLRARKRFAVPAQA